MDIQRIRFVFYFIAILLGAIQAWNTRFYMTPDGISYLDIGDAYLRGDWNTAFNAYWGPLYSVILGSFLFLFKPSSYFEFPFVHLINFMIFIASIFCFNFFIDQFLKNKENKNSLPNWALYSMSCTIFLYTSLKFTNIWISTPDLLLSCFVYLITGYTLKIRRENDKNIDFIVLGALLGFAYLTKAIMFVIAFVYLAVFLIFKIANFKKVILSLFIFLIIASPYIFAISKEKNRVTFGDSGKLNYVWQVNNVTAFYMVHWQGGVEEGRVRGLDKKIQSVDCGKPKHSTRKIYSSPDVYEFGNPINATYAPWFDPSYWYEGVKPDLNFNHLLNFFKRNLKDYSLIFLVYQGVLIICFIYFLLKFKNIENLKTNINKNLFLITPPVFTILLYALVFPELRYIASFVSIFWIIMLSAVSVLKDDPGSVKFGSITLIVFLLFTTLFARFSSSDYSYLKDFVNKNNVPLNCEVAHELEKVGLEKGDAVASFGYGHLAFWARLGRYRIVSEIPDKDVKKFWSISKDKRLDIFNIIKNTGARAIVIDTIPLDSVLPWRKLGNTGYYACLLN